MITPIKTRVSIVKTWIISEQYWRTHPVISPREDYDTLKKTLVMKRRLRNRQFKDCHDNVKSFEVDLTSILVLLRRLYNKMIFVIICISHVFWELSGTYKFVILNSGYDYVLLIFQVSDLGKCMIILNDFHIAKDVSMDMIVISNMYLCPWFRIPSYHHLDKRKGDVWSGLDSAVWFPDVTPAILNVDWLRSFPRPCGCGLHVSSPSPIWVCGLTRIPIYLENHLSTWRIGHFSRLSRKLIIRQLHRENILLSNSRVELVTGELIQKVFDSISFHSGDEPFPSPDVMISFHEDHRSTISTR